MKLLVGTVVAVDMEATIEKKDGGTYSGVEFIFKDDQGKTQTKNFHMNQFKFNTALKNTLADLVKGDKFTAEMEKEGEFWNWKKLSKGVAEASTPAATNAPAKAAGGYQTRPNDTYETKEERGQRQVMIVRQSSLTAALKLLEMQGQKKPTSADVITVAQEFEAWVLGQASPKISTPKATKQEAPDEDSPFEDGVV